MKRYVSGIVVSSSFLDKGQATCRADLGTHRSGTGTLCLGAAEPHRFVVLVALYFTRTQETEIGKGRQIYA